MNSEQTDRAIDIQERMINDPMWLSDIICKLPLEDRQLFFSHIKELLVANTHMDGDKIKEAGVGVCDCIYELTETVALDIIRGRE